MGNSSQKTSASVFDMKKGTLLLVCTVNVMTEKPFIFCPFVWVFDLWKKNITTIIELGQIAQDYLQGLLSHLFSSLPITKDIFYTFKLFQDESCEEIL